ncbi:unnamed protein product [Microthlaspi erraticum]|uniref:RING-type E3 ubiquitin transferase n=1 Tax=Microthlaspi erraticum TaxID=1685480 RepID=A0A6D2L7T6_9BRAS|nr:unnamed protein product [Microthlaspi erraticum]
MGLLFPVQCFREPFGVYVTVSCIAPSSPEVGEFSYDISYKVDGQTVIYKSIEAKKILQVSFETPQDNFMLIPTSLLSGGDLLELNLCIKTNVLRPIPVTERRKKGGRMPVLDILDCPICFEALTIPIFQCENGHIVCSSCCPKLSNTCPSCTLPIGHIRNRAMETVVEPTFVRCRNAKIGCKKKFTYGKESEHEKKECNFSPCSCPVQGCDYTGSVDNLEHHYVSKHKKIWKDDWFTDGCSFTVLMNTGDKMCIAREASTRFLFPVQCFRKPYGVYVTVSCIAPPYPEAKRFSYDVSYTTEDGHTVVYKSPEVKRVLEVSYETPQDNFLFIPHTLLRGDESLELKLCVAELK